MEGLAVVFEVKPQAQDTLPIFFLLDQNIMKGKVKKYLIETRFNPSQVLDFTFFFFIELGSYRCMDGTSRHRILLAGKVQVQ